MKPMTPEMEALKAKRKAPFGQAALRRDLEALWSEHNHATDGTTRMEPEYLEVIATRG